MQIQLKQAEIISALKQYIASQGINLTGKTVDITFTAGRADKGLTADLIIEESVIPALDFEGTDSAVKPVLSVVPSNNVPATASIATPETEVAQADPVPEAKLATGTEDAAPIKTATTSLFG